MGIGEAGVGEMGVGEAGPNHRLMELTVLGITKQCSLNIA